LYGDSSLTRRPHRTQALSASLHRGDRMSTTATALRVQPAAPPSALEIFVARCWARAILYAAGELDLHDAVDVLQEAAARTGLLAMIGQDAVQEILAAAFREHGQ